MADSKADAHAVLGASPDEVGDYHWYVVCSFRCVLEGLCTSWWLPGLANGVYLFKSIFSTSTVVGISDPNFFLKI